MMTLSEFLRMAREKLESNQQKPCSNEPSSRARNGLLELVWENGQIVMRDQPSKVNKNHSNLQNMASNTPRIRDLILLHNTKIGKSSEVESIWDDIPSGHLDSRQDDNTTRWFNYAIDDPLPRDYCYGLIPEEISGFTTTQETILSVEKRTSCCKTIGCLQVGGNSTLKGSSSSSKPPLASRQNVQQLPANKTDLLNFSRFSKPAFLAKSNAPPSSNIAPNVPPSLCVGKTRFTENPGKSAVNEQLRNVAMVNSKQVKVKETEDLRSIDRRDNDTCMKSRCARNEKKTEADAYSRKDVPRENNNEKTAEDVVVASSVGSGNNAHGVSCDRTRHSKRKFPDSDESEYCSDDVETESVGAKKTTNGRAGNGSKRNRAAEVHNLSERRRRDRINEKMRALQELIPSCDKADKASMLDEAIEYLKSLQLQVQIMSMGAGLCLPPMSMMYPHFRPPLMGMMGLGFAFDNMMMHGPQIPPLMPGGPRIPLPCSDIGIPCSVLPSPHHATTLHVNPTVMNESSQSMNCLTDQLQQQVMINEFRYDQKTDSVHTTSISNLTSPSTELKEVGDLNRS